MRSSSLLLPLPARQPSPERFGMRQRFCSEAPMARKCIIDTLKYWTKEYGVDGYPSISCR